MLIFSLFLMPSIISAIGDVPTDEPPAPDATTMAVNPTAPSQPTTENPPIVANNGIGLDTNCTILNQQGSLVYSEQATGCFNVWDDQQCKSYFGDGISDGVQAGENNTRSVKCYLDANGNYNSTANTLALQNCAHFCGYCCEKPEFNCTNHPAPTVNCSLIQKNQCFNATMKTFLIQNCPNICGFCNITCQDRYPQCSDWNKYHNYCDSNFYTTDDKKRDCAATCNLC